ncbi:MAG: DUF2807 domain-containing protein [Candidatus Marinimicrobia bacterium]|nr:DUF2807 domain-containing protein [Candidatus Neomarinimicrobiota bacterium]
MSNIKFLLFLILIVGLYGQSGHAGLVTEERAVSEFNAVKLRGTGTVYLSQGNEETLTIEAAEDILPYIESRVSGYTLILGKKRNFRGWGRTGPINYHLKMKDIAGLNISGSGNIISEKVKSDELSLHISGSGDYEASKLKSDQVDVSVSGSGDVTVWVDDKLDVHISGSGKVGYYGRPAVSTQSSGSGQTRHLGDR